MNKSYFLVLVKAFKPIKCKLRNSGGNVKHDSVVCNDHAFKLGLKISFDGMLSYL